MRYPLASHLALTLGSLVLLPHCSADPANVLQAMGTGGGAINDATGGSSTTGGAATGGAGTGGDSTTLTGGAATTTGGASPTGGAAATTGGTGGGATGGAEAGGTTTGGAATGGAATGGETSTGGGNDGTGGEATDVDQNGKSNASTGDSSAVAQDYLKLGEIRILNNNWGSEDLGCSDSSMSVFVNESRAFGWDFNRGDCADNGDPANMIAADTSHPDFPQVEFGIHPFGIGDELVTSPEFSSTPLLPIQLKDVTSASVTVDNLNIALQNNSSWNLAMEFWLSEGDPRGQSGSVDVHTELMAWWGWNNGRWPCDTATENVSAGMSYTLCHQSDTWADNQWRYYQFRAGDASDGNISTNFNGTIDVKAFIDYLMTKNGYHGDLWLTRMEVGSEIDDNTSGTVTMNNITFELNGESRSAEFGD